MQPLSVQQVFALIESNEAPYFKLLMQQGIYGKPSVIANFNPDIALGKDKETKEKIEAAKKFLNSQLSIYEGNHDLFFSIELKRSNTSNQDGIFGPFVFKPGNNNNVQQPLAGLPQQGMFGFGAMQQLDLNNLSGSPLGMLLDARDIKQEVRMERALLERDKADFKEEVKEKMAELKEKEEEYSSAVAAAKKGTTKAIFSILKEYGVEKETLGKVESRVKEAETEEKTPEEEAVENLAEYIHENFKTVEDIKRLHEFIKVNFVEKRKKEE